MRIYLETSVINIYLFGKYSEFETKRFLAVKKLFEFINLEKISAVVSLYSVQEIYSFCKKVFTPADVGQISRVSLTVLFQNKFELAGLLTREERLLNRAKFSLSDLSDQPHAISAFLNKCDAVVTYDEHFRRIKDTLAVYTPDEIVQKFS
ncbi:MAG: hypothetical protein NT096_09370 [Proteobacteria bacterium]|nr:hypothetical protein [Pseudomonadota bacterium]